MTVATNAALILISLLLAALRIGGVTHPSFQAAAHLFVGLLIGWGGMEWWGTRATDGPNDAWLKIVLVILLSAVELFCFVRSKIVGHRE